MRMKVKPKDRPKFIGLMTAVGLLACYIIFVVIPNLPHTTVAPVTPGTQDIPTSPVSVLPVSLSSGVAQNASPVPDANRAALDLIDREAPRNVKRDPFLAPATSPVASAPVVVSPVPVSVTAKPGASTPPAPPTSAALKSSPAPSTLLTDEKFTLLGIADADEAVAIFQLGSNVVEKRPGDHLPGNMRVEAIEEEAVRLSHGKQQFRMEVGQAPVANESVSHGKK